MWWITRDIRGSGMEIHALIVRYIYDGTYNVPNSAPNPARLYKPDNGGPEHGYHVSGYELNMT